ncbi:MAG: hypothetical protein QXP53_00285 [Candidatus Pacearchaeota archaeon]
MSDEIRGWFWKGLGLVLMGLSGLTLGMLCGMVKRCEDSSVPVSIYIIDLNRDSLSDLIVETKGIYSRYRFPLINQGNGCYKSVDKVVKERANSVEQIVDSLEKVAKQYVTSSKQLEKKL